MPASFNLDLATRANFKTNRGMKKILSLKTVLLGLGCAGALNVFAFTTLDSHPRQPSATCRFTFEAGPDPTAGPAQFITRGCNYQFLLSPTEVRIALGKTGCQTGGSADEFCRGQSRGANVRRQRIARQNQLPHRQQSLRNGTPVWPRLRGCGSGSFIRASTWCTTAISGSWNTILPLRRVPIRTR